MTTIKCYQKPDNNFRTLFYITGNNAYMQSDSKIKKVEGHLEYINDKLALVNMTPNHISIPCIPCKTKTYSLRSINQSHTSSITSGMTAQLEPNSDYDCGWVNCMTRLNTFLSNRKDTDTFIVILDWPKEYEWKESVNFLENTQMSTKNCVYILQDNEDIKYYRVLSDSKRISDFTGTVKQQITSNLECCTFQAESDIVHAVHALFGYSIKPKINQITINIPLNPIHIDKYHSERIDSLVYSRETGITISVKQGDDWHLMFVDTEKEHTGCDNIDLALEKKFDFIVEDDLYKQGGLYFTIKSKHDNHKPVGVFENLFDRLVMDKFSELDQKLGIYRQPSILDNTLINKTRVARYASSSGI